MRSWSRRHVFSQRNAGREMGERISYSKIQSQVGKYSKGLEASQKILKKKKKKNVPILFEIQALTQEL